jgi:hypothetical protein
MARIVLGLATSHSPLLSTPIDQWEEGHAAKDRRDYAAVLAERSARNAAWIGPELTIERWRQKYAAVQEAIARLGEGFAEMNPDVVVIVGDDQQEVFRHEARPALALYCGEFLHVVPPDTSGVEDFRRASKWAEYGDEAATYTCEPTLGKQLIESLVEQEFDVMAMSELPPGRQIGHAYNFVSRRLMRGSIRPYVPIMLNVFYGLNQPTLRRCYQLGKALRRAIESWENDSTVAVIASGGLSHTMIDEELDRGILAAMQEKDEAGMTQWPEERFHFPGKFGFGTGEIKSWVAVAGAMQDSSIEMNLVDYIPLYRTSAGTGVGAAFAYWR